MTTDEQIARMNASIARLDIALADHDRRIMVLASTIDRANATNITRLFEPQPHECPACGEQIPTLKRSLQ